jgi:hypothetical protein
MNKKKQKNFFMLEHGVMNRRCHTTGPRKQEFFGSFLQKRTAYCQFNLNASRSDA